MDLNSPDLYSQTPRHMLSEADGGSVPQNVIDLILNNASFVVNNVEPPAPVDAGGRGWPQLRIIV